MSESYLGDDPRDLVARFARADCLEELARLPESHAVRGRAYLWAWALAQPGRLCFVEGMGRRPLVAHFTPHDPATLTGDGWDEPGYVKQAEPPSPSVRLVFQSPGHDIPGEKGRQRRLRQMSARRINAGACPWLLPTAFDGAIALDPDEPRTCDYHLARPGAPVMAGAGVAEFCAAVELAGGWWLPLGELA